MIQSILRVIPYYQLIIIILSATLLWTILACNIVTNRKIWRLLNILLSIVSLFFIYYFTLHSRITRSVLPRLIPFCSFFIYKDLSWAIRTMVLNIFLFFPLGLTFPYAIPKISKYSVLICALTSLSIEIIQLVFHLGACEVDDLIMNTLGGTIGYMSYYISSRIRNRKAK